MRPVSRSWGEPARAASRLPDRAQVEPIAALVALLAVGAGLGCYAVALDAAAPDRDRAVDEPVLDRVQREASVGGVLDPDALAVPERGVPPDAAVLVEVRTDGRSWRVGDPAAARRGGAAGGSAAGGGAVDGGAASGVAVAERRVTVAVAPGETAGGTLRVAVRR